MSRPVALTTNACEELASDLEQIGLGEVFDAVVISWYPGGIGS